MTWILKDDESSEGFAECSAFQNGLQNAEKNIVDNQAEPLSELELALSALDRTDVSFNLFRHNTETNAYMIRKVLIIGKLGWSDNTSRFTTTGWTVDHHDWFNQSSDRPVGSPVNGSNSKLPYN